MRAFFFDGESGEKIREEAIPADYLDKAKEYRAKMIEGVADVDDGRRIDRPDLLHARVERAAEIRRWALTEFSVR
jgi:hypothetical protein